VSCWFDNPFRKFCQTDKKSSVKPTKKVNYLVESYRLEKMRGISLVRKARGGKDSDANDERSMGCSR
jgi:hypothetical protein